ncbi:hypothetical protein MCOR25_010995 [Pyricularia grisea]|uniref:Uncharacterized protein n=1 Tax=Pyricularia grisea TaxID=148305 RepID=A0A6P8B4I8_PYRGI|nr:hypothetical protein PgNI_05575 [Pyricularia grisea]KAI6346187.1 hypothetical protein MCOR25_010995 [Pyricularia grisea]TLD10165.1 hypothetical protein PgNI_05575 [Pyricularia grisea]
MFSATLARRLAAAAETSASGAKSSGKLYISRYPAKKVWPPDYSKLTPQAQLKYEKKYKRRVAMLSERPRWDRFVKLAQLLSVTSILTYAILFMKWEDERHNPFFGIKKGFWAQFGYTLDMGTKAPIQSTTARPDFNKNPQ